MSNLKDETDVIIELQSLIRQVYPALSPAEQKFVNVLLSHQHNLASYTATELADLASVSKSTAARCFKRLGFSDFNQFRTTFRPTVMAGGSPLSHLNHSLADNATTLARFTQHIETEKINLDTTLADMLPDSIERTVQLLSGAQRTWVAGFRNSYVSAFYAQSVFAHILTDVRLINDSAGRFADSMADMSARDILFVVDLPRRVSLLPKIMQVAQDHGLRIIIISNSLVSTLSTVADVVLPCANKGSAIFDSYAASISVINFIASELAQHDPQRARDRLQRIEQIHQITGDLSS